MKDKQELMLDITFFKTMALVLANHVHMYEQAIASTEAQLSSLEEDGEDPFNMAPTLCVQLESLTNKLRESEDRYFDICADLWMHEVELALED
jgi:hypothetical protein